MKIEEKTPTVILLEVNEEELEEIAASVGSKWMSTVLGSESEEILNSLMNVFKDYVK